MTAPSGDFSELPSRIVGQRMRELRRRRDWTAKELAERLAAEGMPELNQSVIAKIETRRRAGLSVDELLVLASVLDVSPLDLLVPFDERKWLRIGNQIVGSDLARAWIRGERPLPRQDAQRFVTTVPDEEWVACEKIVAAALESARAQARERGDAFVTRSELARLLNERNPGHPGRRTT